MNDRQTEKQRGWYEEDTHTHHTHTHSNKYLNRKKIWWEKARETNTIYFFSMHVQINLDL